MKKRLKLGLVFGCLMTLTVFGHSQGLIGIGATGVSGIPDTTHFGDTLNQLKVWVVNRGVLPISNVLVDLKGVTSQQSSPFQMGQLDLTLGLLQPGDSAEVPLDYFVVSPQNSNSGSNIMVIWPTAPGTSPEDSAKGGYWVDSPTNASEPLEILDPVDAQLFPNPTTGKFRITVPESKVLEAEFTLIGLEGKVLEQRVFTVNEELDLGHLRNGIYGYRVAVGEQVLLQGRFVLRKD